MEHAAPNKVYGMYIIIRVNEHICPRSKVYETLQLLKHYPMQFSPHSIILLAI